MTSIAKHTLCSPIILRYTQHILARFGENQILQYMQHILARFGENQFIDYSAIRTYTPSVDVQYAITEDINLQDVEIWLYTAMGTGTVHRLSRPLFKHLRKYVRKTLIHNIDKEV